MLAETPLWVPLAVAGLGLLGTIAGTLGGVLLAQRRADARERLSWNRERERQHEQWAREDVARTFEHRREAYVDFYESLREMAVRAYDHGMGLSEEAELGEWQFPTFRKLQHLRLYATPAVDDAATTAYGLAWRWGHGLGFGQDNTEFYERQEKYDAAHKDLLRAIRADLGSPGDLLPDD